MASGRLLHQLYLLIFFVNCSNSIGILYPRDSESRVVKNIDGIWDFRADTSTSRNQSFVEQWWLKPLSATGAVIPMPVPSSFNDITTDKSLRDFVGWVWYEREFFVSNTWQAQRVLLRFGSVHYFAKVWVNGQQVMTHDGGHLPFEGQINSVLNFNGPNRVTVAVNNTLLPTTLPPGSIHFETDSSRYPKGYFVQNLQMDFFNYAGIHRHVHLYTTPQNHVDDITIVTTIQGKSGVVSYSIAVGGVANDVQITIEDRSGKTVSHQPSSLLQDTIIIPDARLWWPWTMNPHDPGFLYTLKTQFVDVICLNRYYAWYSDVGHTELIQLQLATDFAGWRAKHNKPIMITEYGADTIPGFHQEPSFTFTEEYQVNFMSEYHNAFDKFRTEFLVGEMVWNFADFMTSEGITRVVGNKKGVLTRQRQPKSSGHLLRRRYLKIANSTQPHFPTQPSQVIIG